MKAKEKKFVANTSNKRETKPKKHKSKAKGSDSIKIALKCLEKGKKVTFTKICKKYGLFSLLSKNKVKTAKISQGKQKLNTNEISM